jgi:hypothetical protein
MGSLRFSQVNLPGTIAAFKIPEIIIRKQIKGILFFMG